MKYLWIFLPSLNFYVGYIVRITLQWKFYFVSAIGNDFHFILQIVYIKISLFLNLWIVGNSHVSSCHNYFKGIILSHTDSFVECYVSCRTFFPPLLSNRVWLQWPLNRSLININYMSIGNKFPIISPPFQKISYSFLAKNITLIIFSFSSFKFLYFVLI